MNARWTLLLITYACGATTGCAGAEVLPPTPPVARAAAPATDCQRDHVHVFLVNGMDPFFFCQFNKMPCYVRSLGYEHVYLGQMTARGKFLKEIRNVRATDPCARIALVGFSTGANTVCSMTHTLKEEGCEVDLLIYLGGCWMFNLDSSRPQNAERIVNIRDSGLVTLTGTLLRGQNVDGAENVRIPGLTLHLMTPLHPTTQDTLARVLDALAAEVPVPANAPAPPPVVPPPGCGSDGAVKK
jgi:hypothetical protein